MTNAQKKSMHPKNHYRWRFLIVLILLVIAVFALVWRLIDLSIFDRNFLLKQSDARAVRVISTPAYRGMVTDRFGIPLAISTPMDSVWVNPQLFQASWLQLNKLSKLLGMRMSEIKQHVDKKQQREFVYLRREMPPEIALQIKNLNIPGVFFQREYRRYYPESEVTSHVIGFTNIDDVGQEGLELAYDKWLRGIPGRQRVLKDRLGNTVAVVDVLSQPIQGHDLTLSIDDRIQYLAYKDLQDAIQKSNAESGSVIIVNAKTGEILALANLPSYNPNQRPLIPDSRFRNRAATDVFEPGSTVKPFSIATALTSGKFTPESKVDTSPGKLVLNGNTIQDAEAHQSVLTLTQVLQMSSNIGTAKTILTLPPSDLVNVFRNTGFGSSTESGFPGEVTGYLPDHSRWSQIDLATLSFGYGISVTAMQLAKAYLMIANHGSEIPLTFLKQNSPPTPIKQVLNKNIADEVLAMLETVVQPGGTATAAAIQGYRVAGKTGTAYIAIPGGYDRKRYTASFVGIVPVSDPQLITVVVLNNVHGDLHFGGEVAAPAYANITAATLRIMDVPPDKLTQLPQLPKPG